MNHHSIGIEFEALLKRLLLDSTVLADLFQARDPAFLPQYKAWLKQAESLLKEHDRAEASELAGIRAEVVAVERGDPPGKVPAPGPDRGPRRKKRYSLVAHTLPRAQETLQRVLYPLQERLEEARDIVRQMVVIGFEAGLIQQMNFTQGSSNMKLQALAGAFAQLEHTRNGVIRVKMLVSQVDFLVELLVDLKLGT